MAITGRKYPSILAGLICLALNTQVQAQGTPTQPKESIDWAKEQRFWSFQKPRAHAQPKVKNTRWPQTPLDYFILDKIERKGISPTAPATRRELIRRATFDLTGLPPTPQEVDAFLADTNTGAYERVIDRLLASPRFGERLASMWLPLARYAEDQAHQVGDDTKFFYPNAYKYRDWVIGAFNRDLPYDQFIKLQLAADKNKDASNDIAALGFLGLGPKYYDRGDLGVMADEWEDRVDTVCRSLMGLTVSCARCHDHKFDPITAKDYYALAGVFASTKMINRKPDGKAEGDDTDARKMNADTLHVVEDGTATNLNVFLRGNPKQKGPLVERRFLRVLCDTDPPAFKDGSGRAELAADIASASNPLTARVIVNRLWAVMFGRPLVMTPSNFGRSGSQPSHPELLDDLAVRFMQRGWSIKSLLREMALSSTYRQSSRTNSNKVAVDAPNTLLWRMNRRRLTVEQWRDTTLFVNGELDLGAAKSTELNDPADHHRTVCARISRLKLNDMLALFDYPDANVHAEKRSVTTTPTQKLFLLNSPFIVARAKAFAKALASNPDENEQARIRRAYLSLYSREPDPTETAIGIKFVSKPTAAGAKMTRWEEYAQILLSSNEMLFVD